jgi:hypothetical protein
MEFKPAPEKKEKKTFEENTFPELPVLSPEKTDIWITNNLGNIGYRDTIRGGIKQLAPYAIGPFDTLQTCPNDTMIYGAMYRLESDPNHSFLLEQIETSLKKISEHRQVSKIDIGYDKVLARIKEFIEEKNILQANTLIFAFKQAVQREVDKYER